MSASDTAISDLSSLLQRVLSDGDVPKFRELLRGRYLPALGGDATPAEILGQVIEEAPDFPAGATGTARLLTAVFTEEAKRLRRTEGSLDAKSRAILINALRLAAALPAENALATSLKNLLAAFRSSEDLGEEPFVLWHALWRALARQQVDDSLEDEWLALLGPFQNGSHRPEWQTLALEAWRGLLRIPPSSEAEQAGKIIDFDRVERGLIALNNAVAHQDGLALLRLTLEILVQTYPRSAEFWISSLTPLLPLWPTGLQQAALGRWPELAKAKEVERSREIYLRYRDRIMLLLTRYGFSDKEAEDLCLESFRRLFKSLHSLRDESQIAARLRRETKMVVRSRPRIDWAGPGMPLAFREYSRGKDLPQQMLQVIFLHIECNLGFQAIAKITGLSVDAVEALFQAGQQGAKRSGRYSD